MKKILFILISGLVAIGSAAALAKGPENKHKEKAHKEKALPPGLQKKLERTGQLPPGWQKKLVKGYRLEPEIYRHAEVIDHREHRDIPIGVEGSVVVRIDDRLVRLVAATHEILEIIK